MTPHQVTYDALSHWHREILARLLLAEFPGKAEIQKQLVSATFEVIDANQSLKIVPSTSLRAPVQKTIPVEGHAPDQDEALIQVLLFTRDGRVSMLELLREDGEPIRNLPPVGKFEVLTLAP
jgi:hypothetical protein